MSIKWTERIWNELVQAADGLTNAGMRRAVRSVPEDAAAELGIPAGTNCVFMEQRLLDPRQTDESKQPKYARIAAEGYHVVQVAKAQGGYIGVIIDETYYPYHNAETKELAAKGLIDSEVREVRRQQILATAHSVPPKYTPQVAK